MADAEHLALLMQGAATWNQWRQEHPKILPNFSKAQLCGVDLSGAHLHGADFSAAHLRDANLRRAEIREDFGVFLPPLIPSSSTLHEELEMLSVCHNPLSPKGGKFRQAQL